jgi:GDPmannose 4,6-dehydratase
MSRRALITGITGQDGSYLADLLLEKGYEVHGVVRRTSTLERSRLNHLYRNPEIFDRKLFLHYADLEDTTSLRRIFLRVAPEEIYHLAGQSHVGLSFAMSEVTCDLTAMGTLRLLEIVRDMPVASRLFHASSSEIFGKPECELQDETTPYRPVSPYGCAKAFATQMVKIFRESYGLFATNGIMYNHESPRRGENFVTRKISRAAAEIKLGRREKLFLGNLDARRDWGYAPDYVLGMWMTLQEEKPGDYLFATGEAHSIRDLAALAFGTLDLDWTAYVEIDPSLIRPDEPAQLRGNAGRARRELGWSSTCPFSKLISMMTHADLAAFQNG